MFTGIIEEIGEVVAVRESADVVVFTVRGRTVTSDARHGDSIAVNGVCLTVVQAGRDQFTADVMGETLRHTALGRLLPGDPVNLERAVTPDTRLGGHFVQGHVDGTGIILDRSPQPDWEVVRIGLSEDTARYVVHKGSIAVDGVSLTVSAVGDDDPPWFEVSLIPTTLSLTTLGKLPVGAEVNLEVDVLAKYVERLLHRSAAGGAA